MSRESGIKKLEEGFKLMLEGLHDTYGLNLNDPNFTDTPKRVAKAYIEMNKGIDISEVRDILMQNFPSEYDGLITENKIQTFSLCPHHFLPVRYEISFGYIPNENVLGLSKIPRFIKLLSQSPKLQEDFTQEIVNLFDEYVRPEGCGVFVKGWHLCMGARGISMPDTATITSALKGNFKDNPSVKDEFFKIIKY